MSDTHVAEVGTREQIESENATLSPMLACQDRCQRKDPKLP